jgi:hypothetical protein
MRSLGCAANRKFDRLDSSRSKNQNQFPGRPAGAPEIANFQDFQTGFWKLKKQCKIVTVPFEYRRRAPGRGPPPPPHPTPPPPMYGHPASWVFAAHGAGEEGRRREERLRVTCLTVICVEQLLAPRCDSGNSVSSIARACVERAKDAPAHARFCSAGGRRGE